MRIIVLVLAILGAVSVPAHAEDDPMEAQRCIWRCLANSRGADDPAYQACVDRRCNDGPAEPRAQAPASRWQDAPVTPKTSRRLQPAIVPGKPYVTEQAPPDYAEPRAQEPSYEPPAAAYGGNGRWTYGYHPVLGRAAYIDLGGEAFGLACIDGADPRSEQIAAARMTPGLAPNAGSPGGPTAVFSRPFAFNGLSSFRSTRNDYLEERGDVCMLPIGELQRSAALLFLQGNARGFDTVNGRPIMELNQFGRRITIGSEADLRKAINPVVVPLAGSGDAIRRLAAECPALWQQMAEGCDPSAYD